MAKYIKQEMPDIHQTGEKKVYYRMQTRHNIDAASFIKSLCRRYRGLSEGDVIRVLTDAADHLAELLADGNSVTIGGIGTFKATIGLDADKEMDTLDGNDPKRNARSLKLNGVNYRADRKLIKEAGMRCSLERAGVMRLHRSPYTKEERLKLALDYLEKQGAMHIIDYMELTGLSRTTATLELQEFRDDHSSGIDFIGRGKTKAYIKRR